MRYLAQPKLQLPVEGLDQLLHVVKARRTQPVHVAKVVGL